jgi:hypothetical protein
LLGLLVALYKPAQYCNKAAPKQTAQRNHNAQHNALTEHQQAEHQRNAAYQFNG